MQIKMYIFLITINSLAALVSFVAAHMSWQKRAKPSAPPLSMLSLFAGFWALCYTLELASPSLEGRIFWLSAKYPAATLLPLALSCFLLRFSGMRDWPSRRLLAALLLMPVATVAMVATNSLHHLFWTSITLTDSGGFFTLDTHHGPWFWLHAIYSYGLILASSSVALSNMTRLWRVYNRQMLMLIISLSFPLAGNLTNIFGLHLLPGVDISPVCFGITALLLLLTTNLVSILDVSPLAYAKLVEQMSDSLLILDEETRIVDLNLAAEYMLSINRKLLLGRTLDQVEHPALVAVRQYPESSTAQREFQIIRDGKLTWYELRISPLTGPDGQRVGLMVIWHDVTRRKQIETELRYASTHDQLTGLNNRLFFEEEFARIGRGRDWPVAVVIGDLDNLKETNDNQGHPAGDALLRHTADTFRSCVRAGDLLARIGGDEFAVVLTGCDGGGVDSLLLRLREAFESHNQANPTLPIEISLGSAVAENKPALEQAFQLADEQMYADKNRRKQ